VFIKLREIKNMKHTSFEVEGTTYLLRYEVKQLNEIRESGPKKFLPDSKIKKFQSPLSIVKLMDDIDVQVWLIELGLQWKGSGVDGIDFDKAAQIRQDYLEQGEPDSGEKYEGLLELLFDAISLNVVGANGKKLKEKGEAKEKAKAETDAQTKVEEYARINEARILAQARAKPKLEAEGLSLPGTNGNPSPANSA
jgi:hypothetical protein